MDDGRVRTRSRTTGSRDNNPIEKRTRTRDRSSSDSEAADRRDRRRRRRDRGSDTEDQERRAKRRRRRDRSRDSYRRTRESSTESDGDERRRRRTGDHTEGSCHTPDNQKDTGGNNGNIITAQEQPSTGKYIMNSMVTKKHMSQAQRDQIKAILGAENGNVEFMPEFSLPISRRPRLTAPSSLNIAQILPVSRDRGPGQPTTSTPRFVGRQPADLHDSLDQTVEDATVENPRGLVHARASPPRDSPHSPPAGRVTPESQRLPSTPRSETGLNVNQELELDAPEPFALGDRTLTSNRVRASPSMERGIVTGANAGARRTKPQIAEWIEQHEDAVELQGEERCHACKIARRKVKTCWTLPDVRSKCSACVRGGIRCSLLPQTVDQEQQKEDEDRKEGLWELMSRIKGAASTIDALNATYARVNAEGTIHQGLQEGFKQVSADLREGCEELKLLIRNEA